MRRSLRSWLWRVPVDQEVDEELALHLELRTREFIAQGLSPKAAREMALRRIGDIARLKRVCIDVGRKRDREMRLTQWLHDAGHDIKVAFRQLKASPSFTVVAALTLALGIGANSAMFALADATLLRPLPFHDPERLVIVEEWAAAARGGLRSRIAPLNFHDWKEQNRTFESMAAVYVPPGGGGPALADSGSLPEAVPNQNITPGFFEVFGVTPLLGRTFSPADDVPGAELVVVLSEPFWRARFGGDASVVGRRLMFDGRPHTVAGIIPAEFQFFRAAGMWTLARTPRDEQGRRPRVQRVIGRLKPGVTLDAARSDLNTIADSLARQFGDQRVDRRVTVEPFRTELIGPELRLTSILFLAVVGFVLLMCCANVANLLLARASVRARELAVRSALGAGRRRIVRQLLTESLVLAALGGAIGATIGVAVLQAAPSVIPAGLLPGAVTLSFDGRVLAFCAIASLVVGVLFGLAPAWQATGISLVETIASGGRTTPGRGGRVRSLLVVAQTAAAVLLLCGAGLLLRTLLTVEGSDPGYRAQSDTLLTMDVTATRGAGGLSRRTDETVRSFYGAVQREVEAVPGVQSVAWATTLPMGDSQTGGARFAIADAQMTPDSPAADYQVVSPTYFQTVDVPIVSGRGFTDRDTATSPQVCVVSEAFVRRYLHGMNPIGTTVAVPRFGSAEPVHREIIGVARQVKGSPDELEDLAQIYIPNSQDPWQEAYLLVRAASGPADAMAPAVRAAIARVDRDLPVRSVMTLEQVGRGMTERYRFRATLVGTFAVLALVLAMIGVFGVLAYSVQQRWREFAVRIALGASRQNVLGLVAGGAARVIALGAAIGLAAAAALGQLISAFLFGVQPLDPVTFAAVAVVLALTAAIAAAAPALRAMRVDPAAAFRSE
jgi:putative ABC transport system permease protein